MKDYKFHLGVKMRFYPSYSQEHLAERNCRTSLFIYNRMVALNNEKYRLRKTANLCPADKLRLDYVETVLSSSKEFQNSAPFLYDNEIDAQMISNTKINYQKAWNNYRKNPALGIPTFHKKKYECSYQTSPHYRKNVGCNVHFTDKHHITVPKLGRCKIVGSPKIMEYIFKNLAFVRFGTITISKDSIDRWFISIQLGSDIPFKDKLSSAGSMRGYDVNVENFYTDSDGNIIENPKFKRNFQKKLSKAQRKQSRRERVAKNSGKKLNQAKNYQKAHKKTAYIHSKITGRRNDFQHVISKREIESQDYLFVEDLKVKNMVKNHCLAYSISDVAWSEFFTKLDYKSRLYGKHFIKVPAKNTTQTCSDCGYVLKKKKGENLTLDDREWRCPKCRSFHIRDHNSAIVILSRGMASIGL